MTKRTLTIPLAPVEVQGLCLCRTPVDVLMVPYQVAGGRVSVQISRELLRSVQELTATFGTIAL